MKKEKWKDVLGYEGYYRVSDAGHVRSLSRKSSGGRAGIRLYKGRMLKIVLNHGSHGYPVVSLSKKGKVSTRGVHTLVLEAFLGPCPKGKEACHFPDRDVTNNNLSNLRWDTPKANASDRNFHGMTSRGWKVSASKTATEIRWAIVDLYKTCGYTVKQLSRIFGKKRSTVRYLLTNPPKKR